MIFHDFLREEYSNENLEFWSDVEKYKTSAKRNSNIKSKADKMFSKYFTEYSPHEVTHSFL